MWREETRAPALCATLENRGKLHSRLLPSPAVSGSGAAASGCRLDLRGGRPGSYQPGARGGRCAPLPEARHGQRTRRARQPGDSAQLKIRHALTACTAGGCMWGEGSGVTLFSGWAASPSGPSKKKSWGRKAGRAGRGRVAGPDRKVSGCRLGRGLPATVSGRHGRHSTPSLPPRLQRRRGEARKARACEPELILEDPGGGRKEAAAKSRAHA